MLRLMCGFLIATMALLGAAGFRASAVKVDITPKNSQWLMGYAARRSTGVHDKIYHRVVAMDAGDTQFYLVSSDLCLFSPALYDEVAQQLQKEAGIEPRQVWWSVTHTHAAPEIGAPGMYKALLGRSDHEWDREYTTLVTQALVRAVLDARQKLEPARIAFGSTISMANINRRARDVDGKISIGLNPDGPADRQVGLIRLERPDGRPIALVINYAMHGTVMNGENLQISGDGPGVVSAYVEQKTGTTVLYVNGAAGNIAPIYSVYPNPRSGHLSQFNVLLGDRVLEGIRSMGPATGEVKLTAGTKSIETPLKEGIEWPEELKAYLRVEGRSLVRLPVRYVRINDALLWAAPVEMFCEIAIDVRDASPFPHTFYFGYTNGWFGYLPTAKAFEEGGYEPRTSPFTGAAEAAVRQGMIGLVQGMAAAPASPAAAPQARQ